MVQPPVQSCYNHWSDHNSTTGPTVVQSSVRPLNRQLIKKFIQWSIQILKHWSFSYISCFLVFLKVENDNISYIKCNRVETKGLQRAEPGRPVIRAQLVCQLIRVQLVLLE